MGLFKPYWIAIDDAARVLASDTDEAKLCNKMQELHGRHGNWRVQRADRRYRNIEEGRPISYRDVIPGELVACRSGDNAVMDHGDDGLRLHENMSRQYGQFGWYTSRASRGKLLKFPALK